MAAQITVIDPSLRRVIIKVNPGKYLSEVRDEACTKLRLNPEQYMLKRNDKQIDLSLTYRLSGLSPGSKVELIQRSKSPSVVSVALQIPSGLSAEGLASRLIHKFSSDTTLWQILRTFESGDVDGSGRIWNFTERSIKSSASGTEVYGFPRIQAMGRDYATIEDLQKTLAQSGFNDGNVLLKLDLVPTTKSLQQAKIDMQQYFTNPEQEATASTSAPIATTSQLEEIANETSQAQTAEPTQDQTLAPTQEPSAEQTLFASRPTTVYRPPTSSTPQAALATSTDSDFEPSIDLMKQHQASIQQSTRNKRLPTDAELAETASLAASKLASVKSIDIKIVFPDQSSVLAPFTNQDTTTDLYGYVRGLLARPQEGFAINYAGPKGLAALHEAEGKRLIADLKLTGRVLVRVLWADDVGLEARQRPSLKDDVVRAAKDIEIKTFDDQSSAGASAANTANAGQGKDEKKKSDAGGSGGGGKLPKWLKLPGKK